MTDGDAANGDTPPPNILEAIREAKRMLESGAPSPGVAFHGHVIDTPHLVVTVVTQRTWRERLLSWPWRPWQATKSTQEPDPNGYIFNGALYVHPRFAHQMRQQIAEAERRFYASSTFPTPPFGRPH